MERRWVRPVTVEEMYGDWDWDAAVAAVDRSLDPRASQSIFDTFLDLDLGPDDVLLDIGGRDGGNGLLLAERYGCRVISVDPSPANIADGEQLITEHEFGHRVQVVLGAIEAIPVENGTCSHAFSRDMFGHVHNADVALAECARALAPGGAMVLHQVFATDRLEPMEADEVFGHTAMVPERAWPADFEHAAVGAGFTLEHLEIPGSEWYEASQESGKAPNYLLQVSRLRRNRDRIIDEIGEVAYRVVYGNALWSIYQLLGKMESRVYTLRKPVNP